MFPGARELRSAPGGGVFGASHGMLDLYIRKDAFKRVEELSLKFIGGVVHRTDVRFRSQSSSENLTEFSAHVSKQHALPAEFWEAPSGATGKRSRVMNRRGFSVVVAVDDGGSNSLSIVDTTADGKGGRP